MGELGKTLLFVGALLMLLGALILIGGKILGFGKLPGDIMIKRENFSFYFPLTTCLLLSLLISLVTYLWRKH